MARPCIQMVVVPLEDSPDMADVVRQAAGFAAVFGARIGLVQATAESLSQGPERYLDVARAEGCSAEVHRCDVEIATATLRTIEATSADLLVLNRLGSLVERLTHHSHLTILLVNPRVRPAQAQARGA